MKEDGNNNTYEWLSHFYNFLVKSAISNIHYNILLKQQVFSNVYHWLNKVGNYPYYNELL